MIRWSYVEVMVVTFETPSSASARGSAAWYSAGTSMVPTPTMTPWPGMRRGTDWTVPMVPGLVSVKVTPAKSSGVTLLRLTLPISSSYRAWKAAKSSVSASLMHGTNRVRLPSDLATSTARPRPTWGWRTTAGLPSTSV
jgi:hypothetical protein